MANIISDVFEQLGQTAGSAVKQAASDLTVGLVREAKKQIGSRPPEEKAPQSSGQSTQAQKTIQNYLQRDQQLARKRISELRNMIASQNKQTVTTETQKLKPAPPPKTVDNLAISVKQGIGSGEITRGAIG